jgi:signal transduction histidine kinase
VVDDGVGFDISKALDRSRMRLHLGLDALIERVRLAGGDVAIHSRLGEGSRISFWLPLGGERAASRPAVRQAAGTSPVLGRASRQPVADA